MNAKSGSGSSGTFVWGLVAGLVAVLGAGGLYLSGVFGPAPVQAPPETDVVAQQPTDAPESEPSAAPVEDTQAEATTPEEPADETAETAAPEAEAEAEESAPEAPAVAAPVLDQIFVEPDGNTLLSGKADPGSEVNVMLDGQTVHSFTVDDSGQFAEFLSIPYDDDARGLVLETQNDDQPVRSDDYLIAALPEPEPQSEAPAATEAPAAAEAPAAEPETPVEESNDTEVAEFDTSTEQSTDTAETEVAEAETPQAETPDTDTAAAEVAEQEETTADTTAEAPAETAEEPSQQVAILRSGEEGVELVQPPAASDTPTDQVALDTIGYSNEGEVELTGRVQDDSSVRLYLDNTLVADLNPEDDGQWRGEIEGVDPGVYTLRVDEVSPEGDVVSRIETPFQREPIETLLAAEAATNPDSSDNVSTIRAVTVQKGDTLWAISRERFGDGVLYVKLFEANRESIRDPDLIYPGQIFTIPE